MDVLTTMAVIYAVAAGIELLGSGISWLISRWGKRNRQMPETLQVELGETDREMIQKTQELMREVYGEDIVKRYAEANTRERINLTYEFADQLAKLYGVDVDIDVFMKEPKNGQPYTMGGYLDSKHALVLNIYLMDINKEHELFETVVRETIVTVIHEMRHAVQHKAIEQPGFWNIDDVRRAMWARNFENYVADGVDFETYQRQSVEADAFTFAAEAMKGMV